MSPTIEERVKGLENAMVELHDALAAMHATSQLLLLQHNAAAEDEAPGKPVSMKDSVWACTNCGAKLGVYNSESDELRLRYKELAVYMVPGTGGSIMVPCRRCAAMNTLEDTRTTARAVSKAPAK